MKKHAEYLIFAGTSEGRKLAEFFHAESPERMVFTGNATESLNMEKNCLRQRIIFRFIPAE